MVLVISIDKNVVNNHDKHQYGTVMAQFKSRSSTSEPRALVVMRACITVLQNFAQNTQILTCSFTCRRPSFLRNTASQSVGSSHAQEPQTAACSDGDCPWSSGTPEQGKHSRITGAAKRVMPKSPVFSAHQILVYRAPPLLLSGLYPEHLFHVGIG